MKSEPEHYRFDLTVLPKILDRYVAREFLQSYGIAILVVLSLRVILDLFVNLDEFAESKEQGILVVLADIFHYYSPRVFEYFRDFAGTNIILAAAFSLARMMRQNELTAVLASGVSLKRVIAPIVFLGFLLNLVMVADQELILPRLADRLVLKHDEMEQSREVSVWLLPDAIQKLGDQTASDLNRKIPADIRQEALLSAARYEPSARKITGFLVLLRLEGKAVGRITADQADWDPLKQLWVLQNGKYFSFQKSQDHSELEAEVLPVRYYQSGITADYLWLQRNSNYKSYMSYFEITHLLRRGLKPAERAEAVSERHFRFTDPIINMVMLLLGLPMLVSRERRNTKTAIFLAILGAGGCFVTTFTCKLLGGGLINPLLAAWIPIIVFLPLSVIALDTLKT